MTTNSMHQEDQLKDNLTFYEKKSIAVSTKQKTKEHTQAQKLLIYYSYKWMNN